MKKVMDPIRIWMNDRYIHISTYTKKIYNPDGEDILQETIVQFLEMNTGKTLKLIMDGEAEKYLMAMYKVNCFSKTSPYQRKYNQMNTTELFDDMYHYHDSSYNVCWTDLEHMLDELDVFFVDKMVYKEYIEKKLKQSGYSINKMSKDSTIPIGTLDLMFKKIRHQLKSEIKKIIKSDEKDADD